MKLTYPEAPQKQTQVVSGLVTMSDMEMTILEGRSSGEIARVPTTASLEHLPSGIGSGRIEESDQSALPIRSLVTLRSSICRSIVGNGSRRRAERRRRLARSLRRVRQGPTSCCPKSSDETGICHHIQRDLLSLQAR